MSDVERKLALERYKLLEPGSYDRRQLATSHTALTQVERVLGVNDARVISVEIVEAATESLVIGQA